MVRLIYCKDIGRLAYYRALAGPQFWDEHWKHHLSLQSYEGARRGHLGWFEEVFLRYLPRKGKILEAGCGKGQYVLALRVRGFDVEGVEWAPETVKAVKTILPELPIRVGDVAHLDVPDGHYGAYISIGVVEHREGGPEPLLKEARRVLRPGGVAFISVPFFHSLRRLKAKLGMYRGQVEGLQFYQYAFTESEFSHLLKKEGFQIIDQMSYDSFKGLKDEIPWLLHLFRVPAVGWRLKRWIRSSSWITQRFGHMILFVCRRE
jgi:SAM-dependent methyltransferase